jgi:predicted nuclease with TOPRIM domain
VVRTLEEQDRLLTHHIMVQTKMNENLDKELDEIQKTLEEHGQILKEHGKILTRLDERTTRLDVKVTAMDEKFERRFDGLDEKMDLVLKVLTGRSEPAVPNARVASD